MVSGFMVMPGEGFFMLKILYDISLRKECSKGMIAALLVVAALIFINWPTASPLPMTPAAGFCLLLYFLFFPIGAVPVATRLRTWIEYNPRRVFLFPLVLAGLLYVYVFAVNGNPTTWPHAELRTVIFYLTAIPAAVLLPAWWFYRYCRAEEKPVNGWDFLRFALVAGLVGLSRFPFDGIPVTGRHFETAGHLVMMLVFVYVVVVVRRLKWVGFALSFSWRDLLFTIGCWVIMLALFFGMLYPAGLIQYVGYHDLSWLGFQAGFAYFLGHLFRVGMFEELVFRGVFQNMLAQKVGEWSGLSRTRLLKYAVIIAVPLALATTFLIPQAHCRWLPPLIVLLIFGITYLIEKYFRVSPGEYIVLAIISVVFGLAHYRFGEVFMALACLAGWFDGLVYTKTKNVYLAALIHALLNCSPMFLGLQKNW